MALSKNVQIGIGTIFMLSIGMPTLIAQEAKWMGKSIDFSSIESRKDSFHMKQNGKVKGYWVWETLKQDDQIVFKDISVLDSVIEERFTLMFDCNELVTKSVNLKLETKELKIEAQISRKRNTDLKAAYKLSGTMPRVKNIDTTYSKEVIVRPEIFGLLPGIVEPTGLNESLNVFFLSSGKLEHMTLRYVGDKEVTVPVGTFNTYKIKLKSENAVSNIIYLTKTKPHLIVKVDVIGTEMEIVKI